MDSIVLLDFCGTVADFQTLDPYLQFVIKREFPSRYALLCNPVSIGVGRMATHILYKTGIRCSIYKQLLIWLLKGVTYDNLMEYGLEYYTQRIRKHLIEPTLRLIDKYQTEHYRFIILSGGLDFYISHFAKEFNIPDMICAQLEFRKGYCTGRLLSDCMGNNKLTRLLNYVKEEKIDGIFKVAITDSQSDWPILRICKKKIIISHHIHQKWVTDDMKELIWD